MSATSADYSWNVAPGVLLAVVAAAWIYVSRWRSVRASEGARAAPTWRLLSFLAGLITALVALVSPVDTLAEQLATMHMVQHMLLLDIAPILCTLGLTRVILRPVTRRVHEVERRAGFLAHPAFAVVLYAGLLWFWHAPGLYDVALETPLVHGLEHISFTVAGALYWWHLLSPIRSRFHMTGIGPVLYMASTKVTVGLLGILLAFSKDSLYRYEELPRVWGLSAVDDVNVAGLVMALEQSIVMGTALAVLFARGLADSERAQQREDRYADLLDDG